MTYEYNECRTRPDGTAGRVRRIIELLYGHVWDDDMRMHMFTAGVMYMAGMDIRHIGYLTRRPMEGIYAALAGTGVMDTALMDTMTLYYKETLMDMMLSYYKEAHTYAAEELFHEGCGWYKRHVYGRHS